MTVNENKYVLTFLLSLDIFNIFFDFYKMFHALIDLRLLVISCGKSMMYLSLVNQIERCL